MRRLESTTVSGLEEVQTLYFTCKHSLAHSKHELIPSLQSLLRALLPNSKHVGASLLQSILEFSSAALNVVGAHEVRFALKVTLAVFHLYKDASTTSATRTNTRTLNVVHRVIQHTLQALQVLHGTQLIDALVTIKHHANPSFIQAFVKALETSAVSVCGVYALILLCDYQVSDHTGADNLHSAVPRAVARTTAKLIRAGKLPFAMVRHCFTSSHLVLSRHTDLFTFAKLLLSQQINTWAHDLMLLLFYNVKEGPFQLEIITYLIQQSSSWDSISANGASGLDTDSRSASAAWILLTLVTSLEIGSSMAELSSRIAQLLSGVLQVQANRPWDAKSQLLSIACAKSTQSSPSDVCRAANLLLFSEVLADQLVGVSLICNILQTQNRLYGSIEFAPLLDSLEVLTSFLDSDDLLSTHSLNSYCHFVAVACSYNHLPELTYQALLHQVTNYVHSNRIYIMSHTSDYSSRGDPILYNYSTDQPLDLGTFLRRYPSREQLRDHARNLPLVLEALLELHARTTKHQSLLDKVLSGGFCVSPSTLGDCSSSDSYFLCSLLRSIITHLANLSFRRHQALTPLLVFSVHNTLDIALRLSKHPLTPGEKQTIDAIFADTARLDIELTIATLESSDCEDRSTVALVQHIVTHVSRLGTHRLCLEPRFTILDLERMHKAQSLIELANSPPTLLHWLAGKISAVAVRAVQCRKEISTHVLEEDVAKIKLDHINFQLLETTLAHCYVLFGIMLGHFVGYRQHTETMHEEHTIDSTELQSLLLLRTHDDSIQDAWYSEAIVHFFQAQDANLALIVLDAASQLAYRSDKQDLQASLFYLFLTTTYPTHSKTLAALLSSCLSESVFRQCSMWSGKWSGNNGQHIWYAVTALFALLPEECSLGVLGHMSDSAGARVELLTQSTVCQHPTDTTVVSYCGVNDDFLALFMVVLLRVTEQKITSKEVGSEEFNVVVQVAVDLISSLLDLSLLSCPPSAFLTVSRDVLSALLQKLDEYSCVADKVIEKRLLGVCATVGNQVKAVVLRNEAHLAHYSQFAAVLAQCEHFMQSINQLGKLSQLATVPLATDFAFAAATLAALRGQFASFEARAVAMKLDRDTTAHYRLADYLAEDEELIFELRRLRE